jgi:4'-phosphopantetheinyl transferase
MVMRDPEFGNDVLWGRISSPEATRLDLLDAVERARRERYLREEDRRRFTLGVNLTKGEVARRTGLSPERVVLDRTCPDCGAPHGRPRHPGLHLSVTHSGDLVGVAVADVPVGLDVEERSRSMAGMDEHIRSAGEPPGDLYVYWTRKEALLKATGDGLKVPMTELTVSPADAPPALLDWRGRPDLPGRIRLYDLSPDPAYAAALALITGP